LLGGVFGKFLGGSKGGDKGKGGDKPKVYQIKLNENEAKPKWDPVKRKYVFEGE
jgi:hypothetical protein